MAGNESRTYRSPKLQQQLDAQHKRAQEMRRQRDRLDRERREQRRRERRQRLLAEQEAAGAIVETTQKPKAEIMAAELPSLIGEQRTDGVSERSTNESDPAVMAAELPSFVPPTVEGTESVETVEKAELEREKLVAVFMNSFFWDAQTVINAKETFAAAREYIHTELQNVSLEDLQALVDSSLQERHDLLRHLLKMHRLGEIVGSVSSQLAGDSTFVFIASDLAEKFDELPIEQAVDQAVEEYNQWKRLQQYELQRAAESVAKIQRNEKIAAANEVRRTINDALQIDQEVTLYGGEKEGMRKAAAVSGEPEDFARAKIRESVQWANKIAEAESADVDGAEAVDSEELDEQYWNANARTEALHTKFADRSPGRSAQITTDRPRRKKAGWVDQVNPSVDTFRERPGTTPESKRDLNKERYLAKRKKARAAAERRRQQIRGDYEQESTEVDPRYLGKRTKKKSN